MPKVGRAGNPLKSGFAVINMISFLFLMLLVRDAPLFLLIILSEVVSLWFLRARQESISLLFWQLSFFTYVIWGLITDPVHFLNAKDIPGNVLLFLLLVSCAIEVSIVLYIVFNERAVVRILQALSYASIAVVLILVLFIVSEGLPAFIENDPVELLTTAKWLPNYQPDERYTQTFLTTSGGSALSLSLAEDHLNCLPNSEIRTNLTLINDGPYQETVQIQIDSSLETSLERNELVLEPYQRTDVDLTIRTEGVGSYDVTMTCQGTSAILNGTIDVTVDPAATNMCPESTVKKVAGSSSTSLTVPIRITNLALFGQNYTITSMEKDNFVTAFTGIDYDRENNSGKLYIEAGGTVCLNFTAVLITAIEGEYIHSIRLYDDQGKMVDEITATLRYSKGNLVLNDQNETIVIYPGFPTEHHLLLVNQNRNYSISVAEGSSGITVRAYIDDICEYDLGSSPSISPSDNRTISVLLVLEAAEGADVGNATLQIEVLIPGQEQSFGILGFIAGTVISAAIALIIAVPLALSTSILLAEYAPRRISALMKPIFELLAGIPSVVYGLWGIFALGPLLKSSIYPAIVGTIGGCIPFFSSDDPNVSSIMTASIVLSVMILPIILSLSYDAMMAVPKELKESSLALGSSKWQMIRHILLRNARSGIISSIVLGLGRAVGETMAVLMIMGAAFGMPGDVFDSASTMTSIIATQFPSYSNIDTTRHVLFAVALVLFFMILLLNITIIELGRHSGVIRLKWSSGIARMKKAVGDRAGRTKPRIDLKATREVSFRGSFRPSIRSRTTDAIIKALAFSSGALVLGLIAFIILDVIMRGGSSMQIDYLLQPEKNAGLDGGFLNAILGSVYLVAVALAFAVPLSVGSAIYVHEFCAADSRMGRWTFYANTTLASTPSIIFGAFGFMFLLFFLDFETSVLTGGITLGIMIMPLIFVSASEALKAVPDDLRNGSIALGATEWGTVRHLVFPASLSGITSGIIISIGRAIGETAAVLFTAGYATYISESLLEPTASLPNMIYRYYDRAMMVPALAEKLYAVAFTLILVVLVLNLVSRAVTYYSTKGSRS